MITLKGKSLRERQKELNSIVKEAAQNKIDLQELTSEANSDVDRIFMIDLASKYKNIEYVIEQLKSGDSLCVSRALKCEWLYDVENAHIIHPDYLHQNIFTHMSSKIKKKTLSTISIYVRCETRAQIFYDYCMKMKMTNYAYKFLIFTSECFKNEIMSNSDTFHEIDSKMGMSYFRKLIGNSFALADTYGKQKQPIKNLIYLYSVNEEEFLNLFEKYTKWSYYDMTPYNFQLEDTVGVKLSRSILKKHKPRILRNPLLYVNILKQRELVQYSSFEDAQVYAVGLLPYTARLFWEIDYCYKFKHILNFIAPENKFTYIKKIFCDKYPNEEFEMTHYFYNRQYYNLMTYEQRESWALSHLDKQTGVIAEEEDYEWFQFIRFSKSFEEVQKRIVICKDVSKRSKMLEVLVMTTKTQRELEELLNYYYKKHVNEQKDNKVSFVEKIIELHEVFEFDDACWVAFDRILHSLGLYISPSTTLLSARSLIYHIINNKSFPKDVTDYNINERLWYIIYLSRQLNVEKKDLLFQYLNKYFVSKISEFEAQDYNDKVKCEVQSYLDELICIYNSFHKGNSYPDVTIKYMQFNLEKYGYLLNDKEKKENEEIENEKKDKENEEKAAEPKITEGFLLRCLKEDASLILEKLPLIKEQYEHSRRFRINLLLRKIKIYFSNDIGKQYLEFCTKTLNETLVNEDLSKRVIKSIVFAIFQLGNATTKTELMDKYAPTNPKIEHDKIERHVFYTQEAICRFHCYSRPPVPLSKTALYVMGDYVHKCEEMFNMYRAHLPPTLWTDFINLLLNSSLSIQKRGLRLAFETYESGDVKAIVSEVWKKTKNISLRNNIYKLFFHKVITECGKTQQQLFELLKEITLTIHQDDDDEIFNCFSGREVPEHLRGSYLETAWKTVSVLPAKSSNNQRRIRVMESIDSNFDLMDEEFISTLVHDHVHEMLFVQKLSPEPNDEIDSLNRVKWSLVQQYVKHIPDDAKQEKSLNVVKVIVHECFNNWDEDHNTEELVFQSFFRNFVYGINEPTTYTGSEHQRLIHIFEYLVKTFESKFDISEIYSYLWEWKLAILARFVIKGKEILDKDVHIQFGLQLGKLVKEFKDKNCYLSSFVQTIVFKVKSHVSIFANARHYALKEAEVSILVAYGLSCSNIFETYVLALLILPDDVTINSVNAYELPELLNKIKDQNDIELTTLMKQMVIYRDRRARRISFRSNSTSSSDSSIDSSISSSSDGN